MEQQRLVPLRMMHEVWTPPPELHCTYREGPTTRAPCTTLRAVHKSRTHASADERATANKPHRRERGPARAGRSQSNERLHQARAHRGQAPNAKQWPRRPRLGHRRNAKKRTNHAHGAPAPRPGRAHHGTGQRRHPGVPPAMRRPRRPCSSYPSRRRQGARPAGSKATSAEHIVATQRRAGDLSAAAAYGATDAQTLLKRHGCACVARQSGAAQAATDVLLRWLGRIRRAPYAHMFLFPFLWSSGQVPPTYATTV